MSLLLLAQLVAPPTQGSPVRLPEVRPALERPVPTRAKDNPAVQIESAPPAETTGPQAPSAQPSEQSPSRPPAPSPGAESGSNPPPPIQGETPYNTKELRSILQRCSEIADPQQQIQACAAALTARLVADGYVNSRVYVQSIEGKPTLEVVEGRIVEVDVLGPSGRQLSRIQRLLSPLQGKVLHLPSLERELRLLRLVPGVKTVKANLSRLGSDPSQARVAVNVETGAPRWQGDLSVRNDGNNGGGEIRATATLLKPGVATSDDILLIYGELSGNEDPNIGQAIESLSYTFPLGQSFNFTAAFGNSNNRVVDGLPAGTPTLSSHQIQGLGQLEWVLKDQLSQRWSAFIGFSGNTTRNYLSGTKLPGALGELTSGYLRYGITASGITNSVVWGGNAYLMNGLATATPDAEKRQIEAGGNLDISSAMGVGGLVSASWAVSPNLQLNGRLGGQLAFNALLPSMQFSLGSDIGLRGLPGQLISGDSGWLSTVEAAWTVWKNKANALQLVPFVGAGGISQRIIGNDFDDTVGSYGLLLRWLAGENWLVELGGIEQFSTNNNLGAWDDGLLGSGIYAKVQYRF